MGRTKHGRNAGGFTETHQRVVMVVRQPARLGLVVSTIPVFCVGCKMASWTGGCDGQYPYRVFSSLPYSGCCTLWKGDRETPRRPALCGFPRTLRLSLQFSFHQT